MPIERVRTRRTADERRVDVLDVALTEFAVYGLYGASTVAIAARAGIFRPSMLRLFSTKAALPGDGRDGAPYHRDHMSTCTRAASGKCHATGTAGRSRGGGPGDHRSGRCPSLAAAGVQRSGDVEVREQRQAAMARPVVWVARQTGVTAPEVQRFFRQGMMIMVGVSIGAPGAVDEEWARALMLRDLAST
jgi:hypothetical protein